MAVSLPGSLSRSLSLLVAAVVLAPAAAFADDVDDALPDVASVSRRMEVPVEQVAGSITVVGREEIERLQLRTLADVLRTVPGVHVAQSGPVGGQTSIFMRGTESNHTLVLMDGIEVSDPSLPGSVFDAAHLLTENVERIEVMRGPLSSLYGSDAVGGVINVITRQGRGKPRATGWVEYGSFKTLQQSASLQGAHDRGDYALNFTTLHTRGETAIAEDLGGDERDGYDNRTVSGRLGFTPAPGAELLFVGRFIDTDGDVDPFREDRDARRDTRQLFLRSEGRLELLGGRWSQRLAVSYTDHDRESRNDPDATDPEWETSSYDGTRIKLDWQHDLELRRGHVLTLGAETEEEKIDDTSSSESPSFGSQSAGARETNRTSALFLQEQFTSWDRLFGAVGLRLEDDEDFGSELTYRAAAAYVDPRFGTRVHGSIGTAFKAPSLEDRYGVSASPFFEFRGNPDLDPEKSRGWELGIEQPLLGERLRVGVTYFQNRIRDLIEVNDSFDSLDNVARAKTDGFESYASAQLADGVFLRADYTYLSAENRDTGDDLLRRPKHTLSGRLDVRVAPGATASLGVSYVGRRKDIDTVTFDHVREGGYTLVDLSTAWDVTPRLRLFGRVDNLFNREYADPNGFQSPGFAAYAGVRASY